MEIEWCVGLVFPGVAVAMTVGRWWVLVCVLTPLYYTVKAVLGCLDACPLPSNLSPHSESSHPLSWFFLHLRRSPLHQLLLGRVSSLTRFARVAYPLLELWLIPATCYTGHSPLRCLADAPAGRTSSTDGMPCAPAKLAPRLMPPAFSVAQGEQHETIVSMAVLALCFSPGDIDLQTSRMKTRGGLTGAGACEACWRHRMRRGPNHMYGGLTALFFLSLYILTSSSLLSHPAAQAARTETAASTTSPTATPVTAAWCRSRSPSQRNRCVRTFDSPLLSPIRLSLIFYLSLSRRWLGEDTDLQRRANTGAQHPPAGPRT
jgi:hypothetical protein